MSKLATKGYVIGPEVEIENEDEFLKYLNSLDERPFVITKEIYNDFISSREQKTEVSMPKKTHPKDVGSSFEIIKNYDLKRKKKKADINNWMNYFNTKYDSISSLLKNRLELRDVTSIDRISSKKGRSSATIIASVKNIRTTSKGNLMMELEDPTGELIGFINSQNRKTLDKASEIVPDDIVGIKGTKSRNFLFISDIIYPEIPEKEAKKAPHKGSAAFISDIHIGSKMFMPKPFENFLKWLKGGNGSTSQMKKASEIKYLFVLGDMVDGVGVYPGQNKELSETNIYKQYEVFSNYMKQVPEDIQVIMIPGNHDFVRLEEPQPKVEDEILGDLSRHKNIHFLSNPSYVNIHKKDDFPGFDVLNYHGYSFDMYVANVEKLRKQGGYDSADKIMEFLLRKRHLNPTWGYVPIAPLDEDYLFIDKVPDIMATGHIHKSKVSSYKNVITLCSSCWQDTTTFQQRVGHHPEPGRVPIIDLNTRKITVMRFT